MRCKLGGDACGEFATGFEVARHYKTAHPGLRSPDSGATKRAKTKQSAPPAEIPAGPSEPDPTLADGPVESPPDFSDGAAPPPQISKPKKSVRELLGLKSKEAKPSASSSLRTGRRKSGSDLLAGAWNVLGLGVARADGPVGMCLQYQAPIAGEVLDGVFSGGRIDRGIIQPWVERAENGQAIGALLALPALIYIHEHTQSLGMRLMVEPWIEQAVKAHLSSMGPVLRKRAAEEKKLQAIVDEMRDEGLLPPEATNPSEAVRLIIQSMFTETVEEAVEDISTNGQAPVEVDA